MTAALSSPLNPPLPRGTATPAARRRAGGGARADGLSPGQRRGAVALIVAAHAAGVWGLLQVGEVREAAREALPMFVDLIAPPARVEPVPPPPAPPPPAPPVAKLRPVAPRPTPPVPAAPRLVAAAPSPAPSSYSTPPAPQGDPEPAPQPTLAAPAAPPAPAPAPAPPAQIIPPSAVQYLVEPAPDYPRASKRNRETGRVLVLIYIDTAGLPQQVQIARSSGFARLDDAAVAAVAKSRFKPPTVNGQPVSGWTHVPIDFELENK